MIGRCRPSGDRFRDGAKAHQAVVDVNVIVEAGFGIFQPQVDEMVPFRFHSRPVEPRPNALHDFERLLPPPALGPDMQGQQLFGPTLSVRAPVMDACASEGYVRKGDAGGRTIEDLAPAESSDKRGIFGECVMQAFWISAAAIVIVLIPRTPAHATLGANRCAPRCLLDLFCQAVLLQAQGPDQAIQRNAHGQFHAIVSLTRHTR